MSSNKDEICGDSCGEESLEKGLCPVCFEGIYER